jgi:hypothetical protein
VTQFTNQQPATSDTLGNATFTLPVPPQGEVLTGAMQVATAPAGAVFHATAADTDWGQWQGPALHSPVQTNPQVPIKVTATGLLPLTAYNLSFTTTVHASGTEPSVWPASTLTSPFVSQTLQGQINFSLASGGGFTNFGPYPTQGFASLRLTIPTVAGTVIGFIFWQDSTGANVATRSFVVNGPDSTTAFQTPHLGDFVVVNLTNSTGSPASGAIELAQTTETAAAFAGTDFDQVITTVNAGTNSDVLVPFTTFGGPAWIFINPGAATTWVARLDAVNAAGTRDQIGRWTDADLHGGSSIRENLIVPARPLVLNFNNTGGVNATTVVALVFDLWRVG